MIHWRIVSKPILAAAIFAAILAGLRIARLNTAQVEHIMAWGRGWEMAMDAFFFLKIGMIGICCVALSRLKRQQRVVLKAEEQAMGEQGTGGQKHSPRMENQHGRMNSFEREIRILLVDNNAAILQWFMPLLEDARYNISFASDARDALEQLQKHKYDLVIADVMLPDVSGCELTRLIRQRFVLSELPVLLLVGRNRPEDLAACFLAGANDVVAKPVDAVVLKARIRALIELKLSVEELLRVEGAWMKAQIQPHFIYNTLNSIASLGISNTDRMLDLMEVFGNYLRMSFDVRNAGRVVPLERELKLVRCYLYIEEQRFGDRLKVKWELDADMNVLLPPLSIQSLVENALHHGILCRSTGGCIRIRIWSYDQYTEVTVEDNGKGMSSEAWQEWASRQAWTPNPSSTAKRAGGLRSIDARLKRLFGSGLNIVSSPGKGTSVSFHIPKHWS